MNRNTQLARQLSFSTPFHYPEILCQIENLEARRFPGDKIESLLRAAMKMASGSSYTLAEAVDKMTAPLSRSRRHVPDLENLRR